jgi:hypothetical protein
VVSGRDGFGDLEDDWQRDNLPFVRLLFTCSVDVARVAGNDAIAFGRRLEDGAFRRCRSFSLRRR